MLTMSICDAHGRPAAIYLKYRRQQLTPTRRRRQESILPMDIDNASDSSAWAPSAPSTKAAAGLVVSNGTGADDAPAI